MFVFGDVCVSLPIVSYVYNIVSSAYVACDHMHHINVHYSHYLGTLVKEVKLLQ